MTRRVTLMEIATAAGVSTATVSRAPGIEPRITDAVRFVNFAAPRTP